MDTENPLYTPTLLKNSGGLFSKGRGIEDTTINPLHILFLKKTTPENQTVTFEKKSCSCHGKYYVNKKKIKKTPSI